ncbi:hypothetical protein [Rhodanobacter lindaniclasticus]
MQYIGAADDINASRGDIGDRAPGLTYHNVQLKYVASKSLDIAFGIDNLWDKQAPFIQSYTVKSSTSSDREHLTASQLKLGYRLACDLPVHADLKVEVPGNAGLWIEQTATVERVTAVTPFLRRSDSDIVTSWARVSAWFVPSGAHSRLRVCASAHCASGRTS